ncbi:MAG: hypothetical protein IJP45_09125 [Paludibacteraceae bacterium]|nr:hypothetical protein [Paludibacteraceae bacterium]
MKYALKITCIVILFLASVLLLISATTNAEADEVIAEADEIIETAEHYEETEPETVSLSYSEWQTQEAMDVWELGAYKYGISELDTTRALKLITIEGYHDSPLSYYVACCCWVRATEGYWGYGDLFSAFGEADTNYGEWMDCIEYEDWAVEYLRLCYEAPTYCRYCNGMTVPEAWIYEENGIYCWN